MIENQNKTDIVDATDSFEAATVFNGKKILFISIIFICLLLVQAVFWVNHLNWVDREGCGCQSCQSAKSPISCCESVKTPAQPVDGTASPKQKESSQVVSPLAATASVEGQVPETPSEQDIEKLQTELKQTAAEIAGLPVMEKTEQLPEVVQTGQAEQGDLADLADQADTNKASNKSRAIMPKPNCRILASVIRTCNFILVIFTTLYCLTLLMCVKISLTGRLGGLEHISRAFFGSLFMLVIIMPWQTLLPGVVVGMIYTPKELFSNVCCAGEPEGLIGQILYFLRFSGLWLLVMFSLCSSWSRSVKWFRTIQRRLGMLH